eukprot:400369_1
MAQLGFEILPEATAALVSLSKSEIGGIALALENEKVSLLPSPTSINKDDLSNKTKKLSDILSDKLKPCFILYSLNNQITFVYYCPENASVKLKMMCSTAKATVIDIATGAGVVVSNVEEVSSE